MSSPAALRAADIIANTPHRVHASTMAVIIDAEFAAERAELEQLQNALQFADTAERDKLITERAELIEALRECWRTLTDLPSASMSDTATRKAADHASAVLAKYK